MSAGPTPPARTAEVPTVLIQAWGNYWHETAAPAPESLPSQRTSWSCSREHKTRVNESQAQFRLSLSNWPRIPGSLGWFRHFIPTSGFGCSRWEGRTRKQAALSQGFATTRGTRSERYALTMPVVVSDRLDDHKWGAIEAWFDDSSNSIRAVVCNAAIAE